jgi:DNA polymerase-3 subunit delta'
MSKSQDYFRQYEWPAVGNDRLLDFLDKSLVRNNLAQTYIFSGPEDLGKSTVALAFARNLLLSDQKASVQPGFNSDLHILERAPGKKNIAIEQIRDFIKDLSLSSFLNSYKIGIIKEAETLSLEAANALLKTLEEPRPQVIIILLTSNLDALPETIISRASVLYFYPIAAADIYDQLLADYHLNRDEAREVAALAAGRPLLAIRLAEQPEEYQRQVAAAKVFFNFFTQSIASRIEAWRNFLKTAPELTVDSSRLWLDIFEQAVRDLLLLALGQADLCQYAALSLQAQTAVDSLSASGEVNQAVRRCVALAGQIKQAKAYLDGNIAPISIFEQIIYNL